MVLCWVNIIVFYCGTVETESDDDVEPDDEHPHNSSSDDDDVDDDDDDDDDDSSRPISDCVLVSSYDSYTCRV